MAEGFRGKGWRDCGGIIGLANFITEHRRAVEYDLLTLTGHELNDVGRTLSWGALLSFVSNLGADSATAREGVSFAKYEPWTTSMKTNVILADIYDAISVLNSNFVGGASRKKAKRPRPYPRPWQDDKNVKHYGKGALPPDQLEKWFERKLQK